MKTLNKFILLGLVAGIVACGNKEEPKNSPEVEDTIEEAVDLSGMEEVSLSDYQMEASIYIPNNKKPEIMGTDWGSTEIRVGEYFGLEILPSGISVAEFKEQLATDLVYTIAYIEDSENLVIYTKSIEGSDIKAEHHFFMNVEVKGELFEIKSLAEMGFSKLSVEKMVNAAKTFKLN